VGFYVDGPDDLEDLGQQESYSYELVSSHMGADDGESLLWDHDALLEMLDIKLELVADQESETAQR
jgi:hypothetical protein